MFTPTDVRYLYDGSFNGFCCCVFESFSRREIPCAITPEHDANAFLGEDRKIPTENAYAERVKSSVHLKLGNGILEFLKLSLLTCIPDKELLMLALLHKAYYRYGASVLEHETDECINTLLKAVRQLTHEAHQLTGFVRFSEIDGALIAVIHPKNWVLPLLSEHFCARYPQENFLLADASHSMALLHTPQKTEIIRAEGFEMPLPGAEEQHFRRLWRLYYQTIAIEQRVNPKARMSHMQKRYWRDMTEMTEDKEPPSANTFLP